MTCLGQCAGTSLDGTRDQQPRAEQNAPRSDDRHEDVDDVVAPVVLERRPCAVGIPSLREALRSRADLLVDLWRLAVQTDAGIPPARECAALSPECRGVVAGA